MSIVNDTTPAAKPLIDAEGYYDWELLKNSRELLQRKIIKDIYGKNATTDGHSVGEDYVGVGLHQDRETKRVILTLPSGAPRLTEAWEKLPHGFPSNLTAGVPTFRYEGEATHGPAKEFSAANLSDIMKAMNGLFDEPQRFDTKPYTALDLKVRGK